MGTILIILLAALFIVFSFRGSSGSSRNLEEEIKKYYNSDEIFYFSYKGQKDSYYKLRRVKIRGIEKRREYKYIYAWDLEKNGYRHFRTDRIKL